MLQILVGLLMWIGLLVYPVNVQAITCNVNVTPQSAMQNTFETFIFSVNNTSGSETYKWVRLSIIVEDIDLNNPSADGWTATGDRSQGVFTSSSGIGPGQSQNFNFSASGVGPGPVSLSVSAEASSSEDGSGAGSCGTTTINIVTEFSPIPVISNIAIAVGATSATVTWNTDISSTGVVNYGTTNGYGGSVVTAGNTSHSATLSNLSASTTYHYQIQVTSSGGTTSTADEVFTTAASASTSTTTISTPVVTTAPTVTTVTKTVVIADTSPPVVQLDTKLEKVVAAAPIIEGKVMDTGAVNVGISKIQYSVDGGKSWLLVDEPNGASRASFSFVPEVFEDGNYSIRVRATDKSGNAGNSSTLLLIIDRLPPRIIHSLWHVGPLIIHGDNLGVRELVLGVPTQLIVQGVGGVTEMALSVGPEKFELLKNRESGLWEGDISLNSTGEWDAIIMAVDGGGSKIEQKISRIKAASTRASLPSKTSVTVWRFDELTGQFNRWNGKPYSQENPHENTTNWFLPSGTYYFHLSAPGYVSAVSNIFSVKESRSVIIDTQLKKWDIWGFFRGMDQFEIDISTSEEISSKNKMIGKHIQWLEKKEWEGKDSMLSVIPLWDPSAASLLISLSHASGQQNDIPYVVVIPGANSSTVDLLKQRGQYTLTLVADPDGDIGQDIQNVQLPLVMQVNRKGIVEGIGEKRYILK